MSKFIRSALIVAALLTGTSAAMAQSVPDRSDQYGGYHPNSQEGNKAFWEQQSRGGGGSGR
jgi:hypothetical protein